MKNIMIVGATSGIGKQLAEDLVSEGYNVFSMSRSDSNELTGITHIKYDALTDDWPSDQLPDAIHGLAYCPGSINLKGFRSLKEADFEQDFLINVIGAIRAIKGAQKALAKAEESQIVLFSTVAVQTGMPFHSSVAASKGAIEGLTRSLAAELSPTVRVNAIAPSLVDTPMAERLLSTPEKRNATAERHPLKMIGKPESISNLAFQLLSGNLNWATGQIFHIDGGMSSIRK